MLRMTAYRGTLFIRVNHDMLITLLDLDICERCELVLVPTWTNDFVGEVGEYCKVKRLIVGVCAAWGEVSEGISILEGLRR